MVTTIRRRLIGIAVVGVCSFAALCSAGIGHGTGTGTASAETCPAKAMFIAEMQAQLNEQNQDAAEEYAQEQNDRAYEVALSTTTNSATRAKLEDEIAAGEVRVHNLQSQVNAHAANVAALRAKIASLSC